MRREIRRNHLRGRLGIANPCPKSPGREPSGVWTALTEALIKIRLLYWIDRAWRFTLARNGYISVPDGSLPELVRAGVLVYVLGRAPFAVTMRSRALDVDPARAGHRR